MYNIEKSAFRPGEYVGYGGGHVWRIYKGRIHKGHQRWYAYAQVGPDVLTAWRLKDLQAILGAL